MFKTISLLNPKGGAGKTTVATNLARGFHEAGDKVLIVDSDPQGSARDWHAADATNKIDLIAIDRPEGFKSLANVGASYDRVVIDGAAKLETTLAACVKAADLIIIPVQPSPYDIWSAGELVELVKARQSVTDGSPKAVFLLNRVIERTRLGSEVRGALDEYELPLLNTVITQRQIYPQTAAEGQTVFDGNNRPARQEIADLTAEIRSL